MGRLGPKDPSGTRPGSVASTARTVDQKLDWLRLQMTLALRSSCMLKRWCHWKFPRRHYRSLNLCGTRRVDPVARVRRRSEV